MELSTDTAFWLFVFIGILILLGIHAVSKGISTLVTSKGFQERLEQKRKRDAAMKMIGLLLMFGVTSSAMAGTGITHAGEALLNVGSQQVWMVAIIDAILLLILLYLRSQFNGFMRLAFPELIKQRKAAKAKKARSILTDRATIEEEQSILMDHDYDGIQELDNNLPPWWKYGFYLTIVFAVIYLFNFHVFEIGDLQIAEYHKEL